MEGVPQGCGGKEGVGDTSKRQLCATQQGHQPGMSLEDVHHMGVG